MGSQTGTTPEQYELTSTAIAAKAEEAAERIGDFMDETPIVESDLLGYEDTVVLVKDETRQPAHNFKGRGAGNAVAYHAENGEELVVTGSAGSHGMQLGRAATKHGLASTVVVGHNATNEKQAAIKRTGAELIVNGNIFDEALAHAYTIAKDRGGKLVHPFADELVMAGQATIGLELLEQTPDMTHLVLPVGGDGLLAGVASVIKEHREDVKIIAAQVAGNTGYVDSLEAGQPLQAQPINRRLEGIAVSNISPVTFDIARGLVDQTIVIDTESLFRTIYHYKKTHGVLLEHAGGVGPAAAAQLGRTVLGGKEAKVVTVATGANPPKALWPYLRVRAQNQGWEAAAA